MATLTKSTGTVTLSGAAEKVTLPASYGWVWVKNMSDSDIFAGLSADISEGADGVLTIPSGECGRVQTDGFSSIYLLGTGNALVVAQNYADCPFKGGAKGGEIPDLSAYAKKSDIENENLLINPDFKINQRGVSGTFSETGKYFVDRWRLVSGAVTVNSDGTLTLNGTMSQIFENAVGDNVTASVSAGTAIYDNSTKTFSITANGEIISWAKLEYGSVATEFVSPNASTELLKCQRYYFALIGDETSVYNSAVGIAANNTWFPLGFLFPTEMRAIPTISISYLAKWDTVAINENTICNSEYTSKKGVPVLHSNNGEFVAGTTYYLRFSADAEIY